MPLEVTKIADLINPQVMGDMISAKLPNALVVAPFAKVDTSLKGTAGDTITVPQYAYIGDAVDVAEGIEAETVKLTVTTTQSKIKKAMKAVALTDEALESGYGNPLGNAENQLLKAIASKVDADAVTALQCAQLQFDGSAGIISYNQIVDAVDLFNEEFNSEKVMFIHPKQVTQLRKDANFISADKYGSNTVLVKGEIGSVANTRIVPSRRVPEHATFYKFNSAGALTIVATGGNNTSTVDLAVVKTTLPTAVVGDKVTLVSVPSYFNPIIKIDNDNETEADASALTVYVKRNVNVEKERVSLARKTNLSVDEMYTVALTNTSKVVLTRIKKA